jgi:hypothetical protein
VRSKTGQGLNPEYVVYGRWMVLFIVLEPDISNPMRGNALMTDGSVFGFIMTRTKFIYVVKKVLNVITDQCLFNYQEMTSVYCILVHSI